MSHGVSPWLEWHDRNFAAKCGRGSSRSFSAKGRKRGKGRRKGRSKDKKSGSEANVAMEYGAETEGGWDDEGGSTGTRAPPLSRAFGDGPRASLS
eukprot:9408962-Alexandrium_andersonii.AAC.1